MDWPERKNEIKSEAETWKVKGSWRVNEKNKVVSW